MQTLFLRMAKIHVTNTDIQENLVCIYIHTYKYGGAIGPTFSNST